MVLLEFGILETQFMLTRFHPDCDVSSIVMFDPNKMVAVVALSAPLSSVKENPLLVVSSEGVSTVMVPGITPPMAIDDIKLNGTPGTVDA